jgi:hypothetical protein
MEFSWYSIPVEINRINEVVKTGNVNRAGANRKIYLGIGGREFKLNNSGNQFEIKGLDTFVIGTP